MLYRGALSLAQHDDENTDEKMAVRSEFTVAMDEKEILPSIRINRQGNYMIMRAKYLSDETQYFCPAGFRSVPRKPRYSPAICRHGKLLGCRIRGRIDVMLDSDGQFICWKPISGDDQP